VTIKQVPLLRTHNSGVTSEPHCYLALSARFMCTDLHLVSKEKTAIIMLKVLDTTIQNLSPLGDKTPGICASPIPGDGYIKAICRHRHMIASF
jgi:hypothetical protein